MVTQLTVILYFWKHLQTNFWDNNPAKEVRMDNQQDKQSENQLKVTVKPAKKGAKSGNAIVEAYVKVSLGGLWANFEMVNLQGTFYLTAPAKFVESLKGRPVDGGKLHSGFIDEAGISADLAREAIRLAREKLADTTSQITN